MSAPNPYYIISLAIMVRDYILDKDRRDKFDRDVMDLLADFASLPDEAKARIINDAENLLDQLEALEESGLLRQTPKGPTEVWGSLKEKLRWEKAHLGYET